MSDQKREQELFEACLGLDPSRWTEFLEKNCADQPELRRRILGRLRNHIESEDSTVRSTPPELSKIEPNLIGPYRILRRLGEGGMGVVYEAEQLRPVRRRVAIKIIKAGMDTKEVVARFETEQQALALMEHPSIARVFDAGVTPEGRSYFVMEYVPGIPITEHCDRAALNNRERLQLFMQVCDAVQHAHHKAVIHRDLKPSNILVVLQDGRALPKIIDFGIAKALSHPLTEKTVFTEIGQLIGTPEYMSPEQAERTGLDVDTRTDVYSLGVLLYELLTGTLPFDPRELRSSGYEEIRRKIREEDPARPSARVSSLGAETTRLAQRRGTEPSTLIRQLRGDLDWIVLKSLEKERSRRYSSPSDLAADINRHLTDEPVIASPPSGLYRMQKFVRRHRLSVGTASALVLVILLFGLVMAVQAGRIARERNRANEEAATAQAISGFLIDLFKHSDPMEAPGQEVTARELLDRGAESLDQHLPERPLARASFQETIARAYENLGHYDRAESLYRSVLAANRSQLGDRHERTLATLNDLAGVLFRMRKLEESQAILNDLLQQKREVLGEEHLSTLNTLNTLANLHYVRGQYDEAETLYQKNYEIRQRVQGPEHPETLGAINNLSNAYLQQNRLEEALALSQSLLEARRRVQGEDHPDTLGAAANLADIYSRLGRSDEAQKLHEETLQRRRRVLGDQHPDTLTSMNNLAGIYDGLQLFRETEDLYLKTYQGRRARLGERHPDTATVAYNLGNFYMRQGNAPGAEEYLNLAIEVWTETLSTTHPHLQLAWDSLARVHYLKGDFAGAERGFLKLLEGRRSQKSSNETLAETLYNLACVASLQGATARGLAYLQEAVDLGMSNPDIFQDPDLAALRQMPQFETIRTRLKSVTRSE